MALLLLLPLTIRGRLAARASLQLPPAVLLREQHTQVEHRGCWFFLVSLFLCSVLPTDWMRRWFQPADGLAPAHRSQPLSSLPSGSAAQEAMHLKATRHSAGVTRGNPERRTSVLLRLLGSPEPLNSRCDVLRIQPVTTAQRLQRKICFAFNNLMFADVKPLVSELWSY